MTEKIKVLDEDLNKIAKEYDWLFKELKNRTVFVTGSTGLIGSQFVKALSKANELGGYGIHIIALARSKEKASNVFGDLISDKKIEMLYSDVNQPIHIDGDIDYIVHGASATSSRYFVTNPVETIFTAIDGTKNILELARTKKVKGMVYLSSLEVYGTPNTDGGYVSEKDYGYIDPLSVRSSYSEGKRMVECLCASYASEYDVPVRIARLSQTFGPGVQYDDGRVFAEFARCAVEDRDIVLHTEGKTLRTYLYTADALTAMLILLVKGENGQAYNVTNPDTAITIRDMAEMVTKVLPDRNCKVRVEVPENIGSFGYNPEMVIRLVPDALMELGWRPTTDLKNMFIRLIDGFVR